MTTGLNPFSLENGKEQVPGQNAGPEREASVAGDVEFLTIAVDEAEHRDTTTERLRGLSTLRVHPC